MDIFNLRNPSGRSIVLGLTHYLTKVSTRNIPEGKERPVRKADNPTSICETITWTMWDPRRLTTLGASVACYSDSLTFSPRIKTCGYFE
jgi:hypothetical protein